MAETLYIKQSCSGHAYLEPSLPVRLLPDEIPLVEMMGKDQDMDCPLQLYQGRQGWNSQAHQMALAVLGWKSKSPPWRAEVSNSSKTPKNLRLGAVLGPNTIPVTSRPCNSSFLKVTPLDIDNEEDVKREREKIQQALQTVMSEWNQMDFHFGADSFVI
jgi:hypothetical protein